MAETGSRPILRPGRNVWRIAEASRARLLVDAEDYFRALATALERARRQVIILGWDFDGRISLRRDGTDDRSLRELLRAQVEAQPELEIHILVWSLAPVHAASAPRPLLLGALHQEHPRIHLRLDTAHPLYAAHHQKVVCIDGSLAFCGGIDLTVDRWDNRRHRHLEPQRRTPDDKGYAPVHDMQMMVEGAAAQDLTELARARWARSDNDKLPCCTSGDTAASCWPPEVETQFPLCRVAIARTFPAVRGAPALHEGARLTLDAIAAARRSIYIETQYFTAGRIGEVLTRALRKPEGPEVVIVTSRRMHTTTERLAMGENRDRLIRRLQRADRFRRLRVLHPVTPRRDGSGPDSENGGEGDGDCDVLVHSKLIIVDDRLLRVGSSNLNNRSLGLDSECDLAIEAEDAATARAIAGLREDLLAEHLGARRDKVAEAARAHGPLLGVLDALNGGSRGLRAFDVPQEGKVRPLPGTRFLDPAHRLRPLRALLGFFRR